MSGPEFFQTRMGQKFFEGTMPRIADALTTIAERLEPTHTFGVGDLVVVKHSDLDAEEFRVVRSHDAGIHLETDAGRELTIVIKRKGTG